MSKLPIELLIGIDNLTTIDECNRAIKLLEIRRTRFELIDDKTRDDAYELGPRSWVSGTILSFSLGNKLFNLGIRQTKARLQRYDIASRRLHIEVTYRKHHKDICLHEVWTLKQAREEGLAPHTEVTEAERLKSLKTYSESPAPFTQEFKDNINGATQSARDVNSLLGSMDVIHEYTY